ncbi:MAG: cupin domain-containing protein [Candidatus Aadella gelida]|nr:cupin domain-containing protein [Candidatus Aadella gelida]
MERMKAEKISQEEFKKMGINSWPIWEKGVSVFDWSYGEKETCYILEGSAIVISEDGEEEVKFGPGDLVTFNEDLKCKWEIIEPIKKHYRMG